jgi:hypothetical protein
MRRRKVMLLSLLRRSLALPPTAHPCRRAPFFLPSRSISTTPARASSLTPDPPSPEEEAELEAATSPPGPEANLEGQATISLPDPEVEYEDGAVGEDPQRMSYKRFLSTIGLQYKYAKPNNWLGGDVVCHCDLHSCCIRSEVWFAALPHEP